MAKRTYNRRGRQTAKTPVTSSKRRPQRIKGAQTARRTGSKDKMTVSGQRNIKGGPRGAQGPANPPVQGPSRRTPTAMSGDTGRRGGPNQPARSGPPRPAGPRAGRIGSQMRTAASLGTLVNPRSDIPAKVVAAASIVSDLLKTLAKVVLKKVLANPWLAWAKTTKQKKKKLAAKLSLLTLIRLLPLHVVLVKKNLRGVVNATTPR